MTTKQREGVLVTPRDRLSQDQVNLVDETSRKLLEDPGLISYSPEATEAYKNYGCEVTEEGGEVRVKIPAGVLDKAIESAPSTITLGAREPDNKLILDAKEPRVRFGSGSETNIWLDVQFDGGQPKYDRQAGSIAHLCRSAHLCDNLENLDFFIRNVNIQDPEVNEGNKDVNKFLASLNNITKHVQAGLTSLDALDSVMDMAKIIAGGEKELEENPVISFIACVIKSPLQVVEDTAQKVIAIAKRKMPIVISSCPMGGATALFDEYGMVAQINAELLAGVVLTQAVSPGAPVLYGAVPVRTRLDNLYDMYGAPEFTHYNMDCAQMARHYALPCYSTAGVGDTDYPGIQATVEKMMTYLSVPWSGPQYIHYAFGLLERTNVFCPEQAVLDDAHVGIAKHMLKQPTVDPARKEEVLSTIRSVMDTVQKHFVEYLPMPRFEPVYVAYPLEDAEGGALKAAHNRYHEILQKEPKPLPADIQKELKEKVPGILPATLESPIEQEVQA